MVLPCNKSPWYAYHSNLPRGFTMALFHEGSDKVKRLRAQLVFKDRAIQQKDDELQELYDNVTDLRMKMDDLKMELCEESTKASKYFQSADDLQI